MGYVVSNILLYFFLAKDTAFDDAINYFISIYQTGVVFFTAVVTYYIINRPFRSSMSIFTKAQKEKHVMKIANDFSQSDKKNDIIMVSEILEVLKLQKEYLQKKMQ